MAWLRLGDNAATYPRLLECGEHSDADEDTVNLVFGWFMRVAAQAAQHPHASEYYVSMATARLVAGSRDRLALLISFATFGGLVKEIEVNGRLALELINDPEFVHIKTQDELDWERQRREDNGNPMISVPVRMRDGDACRYCGRIVNFLARTGKLAGTYDHRPATVPADPDRSVVACRSCNAERGDKPLEVADAIKPLMPVPSTPHYQPATIKWLHGHQAIVAELGLDLPALPDPDIKPLKPGTQLRPADPAPDGVRPVAARPADPAPQRVRPAAGHADPAPGGVRPASQQAPGGLPAETGGRRQEPRGAATGTPGRAGTGRDGLGGKGAGLDGLGLAQPGPSSARRRRGRRGSRGSGGGRG